MKKLLVLLAATACSTAPVPVPEPVVPSTYMLRLGSDTLAVDQFVRTGNRIEGTLVTHLPRTVVTRYAMTLDPASGRVSRLEFNNRLPDGSMLPPPANQQSLRSVSYDFVGDSVVRTDQRDTLIVTRVAAPNSFPYINYSIAFFQLPITALRASMRDSASHAIYSGGRQTTPMSVVARGSNRYLVRIGPYNYAVATDASGTVLSVDGTSTTQQFIATKEGTVDPMMLASAWGRAETAARPLATLSPRDTVSATVGSTQLWVDYSRPSTRGRRVFGPNGVLNDTLWRTGANAATQFRTSTQITVAGQTVPAGTYTLWTLARPGRYQLIFNRQTGQWGTVYDSKQDLVRVPLSATSLPSTTERFTIAVEPTSGNAGVIKLRWDTTELSVPFTTP